MIASSSAGAFLSDQAMMVGFFRPRRSESCERISELVFASGGWILRQHSASLAAGWASGQAAAESVARILETGLETDGALEWQVGAVGTDLNRTIRGAALLSSLSRQAGTPILCSEEALARLSKLLRITRVGFIRLPQGGDIRPIYGVHGRIPFEHPLAGEVSPRPSLEIIRGEIPRTDPQFVGGKSSIEIPIDDLGLERSEGGVFNIRRMARGTPGGATPPRFAGSSPPRAPRAGAR